MNNKANASRSALLSLGPGDSEVHLWGSTYASLHQGRLTLSLPLPCLLGELGIIPSQFRKLHPREITSFLNRESQRHAFLFKMYSMSQNYACISRCCLWAGWHVKKCLCTMRDKLWELLRHRACRSHSQEARGNCVVREKWLPRWAPQVQAPEHYCGPRIHTPRSRRTANLLITYTFWQTSFRGISFQSTSLPL